MLRMDHEKECGRLTELSDQLQTENQGLRREIESLKERLAEAQQEAASEPGSTVSEQDGGELVGRATDHRIDAAHSLHTGSQPVEEEGESVPNPQPVTSAEEQTVSTPIMSDELMDGKSTMESTTSVVPVDGSSSNPMHITEHDPTSHSTSTGTEGDGSQDRSHSYQFSTAT